MIMAGDCGDDQLKTEEIVDKIKTEITVRLTRAEVEQKLAQLPVTYVYVPREDLELINSASFEGKPLSGRFDVATPHEPTLAYMKQAFVFVDLDEAERVVDVRVKGAE